MSNIYVNSSGSGWTVVTTSTLNLMPGDILTADPGDLVVDYAPELERIATALTNIQMMNFDIQDKLSAVLALGTSTGIRVTTPYEWTKGISAYEWYVEQLYLLKPELTTSTPFSQMVSAVHTILTATDFPSFL